MEDYKQRMVEEYKQLRTRYFKLASMIEKAKKKELDFKLNCPLGVLIKQKNAMKVYMTVLEKRAIIEDISLGVLDDIKG